MQHVELVWPPCCNMLHHVASCCIMLHHVASCYIMLHHVTSCCIMLHHVERSLITIKRLMQHRSTFLLWITVWIIKLYSFERARQHCCTCARATSYFRQGHQIDCPKMRDHNSSLISNHDNFSLHHTTCWVRLATQSNTIQQSWIQQCWMMLHLIGRGFSQLCRWVLLKAVNAHIYHCLNWVVY